MDRVWPSSPNSPTAVVGPDLVKQAYAEIERVHKQK